MSEGIILFEQAFRGDVWRLQLSEHRGKAKVNWRKWYRDGDTLRPSQSGCTMPPERLGDLTAALMAYHGLEPPEGLSKGS